MVRSNARFALFLVCVVITCSMHVFAQGTPLTQGPLTVTLPPGWAKQSVFETVKYFSPDSTPQQYLTLQFLPAEQTTKDVRQRHAEIMNNLASIVRPGTTPQNGVTGKFIWTRMELQLPGGLNVTWIWYSAKAGSTYVAVGLEASRPELIARNLPAIEAMLSHATLNGASTPPGASNAPGGFGSTKAAPGALGLASLDDYIFTPPAGWAAQRLSDAIFLSSPPSETNEKCLLYLLPMRPAGANLLQDATNAFRDVWLRNFVLRNQTPAGFAFPESIIHGYSGQGWEYVIVRKGIAQPNNPQESRLGFVMVAKLDNRIAVISGLSKDPLVSACMGENRGTTNWPKFFYSLGFKSWPQADHSQELRKLLAGEWIAATATAGDLITFAGNGRFANTAAAQQYHLGINELITTTQAYFGNGSYTLRGNAITMKQDDGKTTPGFFRIEQESKDDGRTWADAFYLMRTSSVDGQDYELRFKRNR